MISRKVLETALNMLPVASDDPTRPHISGVSIVSDDAGRVTLAATNGHMVMERVVDAEKQCPTGKYFLHRDDAAQVKLLLKTHKYFQEFDAVVNTRGGLMIGPAGMNGAVIPKQDDDYPNYKAVIPSYAEGSTVAVCLNAEYLLAIAEAYKASKKSDPHITLEFDPSKKHSAVLVHGAPDSIAVVMPVRNAKATAINDAYAELLAALVEKEGVA